MTRAIKSDADERGGQGANGVRLVELSLERSRFDRAKGLMSE